MDGRTGITAHGRQTARKTQGKENDMKDETPSVCPIACPHCHANAGFDRERMNMIRTNETTHATCHACGGRYRIQPVSRYLVDKEPEQ